jgi:hypothetical protein
MTLRDDKRWTLPQRVHPPISRIVRGLVRGAAAAALEDAFSRYANSIAVWLGKTTIWQHPTIILSLNDPLK